MQLLKTPSRSNRSQTFFTGVLKNFAIFTGKHLCWSLFLIKLQVLACDFIKKRLQHRCFPVTIAKFLGAAFFKEHLQWLLKHHPNSISRIYMFLKVCLDETFRTEFLIFATEVGIVSKLVIFFEILV